MRLNRSQGMRPKKASGIAVSVKQCRNCSLIFADPLPIPASIDDHYDTPPEEYFAGHGPFEADSQYFTGEIEQAKKLLSFKPGMTALDIGAGLGKAMVQMQRAGFEAYGLEPSAPFRHAAIKYNEIAPDRLQLGSAESGDFPDEQFNFITFGAVLEHLYDPALSLERALGWLKPGGIIHAEVPQSCFLMDGILNAYFALRGTNYVTNISPMHNPFHLYQFGIDSFKAHARRVGYDIAHHWSWSGEIMFFPRITHGVLKRLMDVTGTGMQLIVYLRKL